SLRLICGKLSFSLVELLLERPRVNLHEKIPFLDVLSLFEGCIDNLAVNAASNRYGIKCGDGAQAVEINREIATLRGGQHDGHDKISHAHPARSSLAPA